MDHVLTMILSLVLVLIVFVLLTIYYFYFLWRFAKLVHIPRNKGWQRFILTVIVLVLSLLGALLSCNLFSKTALLLLHFAGISFAIDLIAWIIRKIREKPLNEKSGLYKLRSCGIIPLAVAMCVFIYGWFNIRNVVETTYTVTTEKNLAQEEYQVLMLADIHYGTTADKEMISQLVDEASQKELDFVLLGGDMVDENTSAVQMVELFDLLGKIPSKYGTYFVFGNHDAKPYADNPDFTGTEVQQTLEENGIAVLEDESLLINNDIRLIGRIDYSSSHRGQTSTLFETLGMERFTLVLDHQPQEYDAYAKAGADLVLSGHTHYGQIFPAGFLLEPLGFADNAYGEKSVGNMTGITTSGVTGWGYPIRTMGHSEYLIVTIKEN